MMLYSRQKSLWANSARPFGPEAEREDDGRRRRYTTVLSLLPSSLRGRKSLACAGLVKFRPRVPVRSKGAEARSVRSEPSRSAQAAGDRWQWPQQSWEPGTPIELDGGRSSRGPLHAWRAPKPIPLDPQANRQTIGVP